MSCPECGEQLSGEGPEGCRNLWHGRTWVLGCDRTGPVAGEWWICHPDSIEEERANPNVEVVTVREIGGTDGE